VLVKDFDRTPLPAMRAALTPFPVRFNKQACAGKNERFDSMQRLRGETPRVERGI
jgi:hypothetical protein